MPPERSSGARSFTSLDQTFLIGEGALEQLGATIEQRGWQRVLMLTSPRTSESPMAESVRALLVDRLAGFHADVRPHAPVEDTERLAESYRDAGLDAILAMGGGSVSDTAKGVSILLAEGGRLEDHCSIFTPPDRLEHRDLKQPKLPVLAVPTTLSAAEVTPGGGATNSAGTKRVFWDPKVAARIVCLDPRALASIPSSVLAATGTNALAHCAEGLYSRTGTVMSTSLAREATRLLASGLASTARDGGALGRKDLSDLQAGAALSGMVISSARVCLHHAVCHVLGGRFGVAHGDANAIVLPHALRFNLPQTRAQQQEFVAQLVAGAAPHVRLADAADADPPDVVGLFLEALDVPHRLRDVGIEQDQLPEIRQDVMQDRGLFFNPRAVRDQQELTAVVDAAW
ncbi:MAG TPA: iron-containing alcohol dehydrogenase [Thermoleophilaceae bacterium]|jgi:alcohol dehydrogenase|nr:iron-containing alcohol dehydrogenase [Thermoleophilaceae bacterium]